MGYAAGVGKTYKMLEEGHLLKSEGIDIVIGYFEPHGRKDTIAKAENLEMLPRRKIEYRGSSFEEMDTDAIVARRPQVCIVDELPHTNVPGSSRTKRWQDVEVLRDAGIHVLATMNIQHLESLNDQVWEITGIRVRETVPDWMVQKADETVMVDLTPRALLHRLQRGVVYEPDKAQLALQNFFRESSLVALREMALRQTAYEVGHRVVAGSDQVFVESNNDKIAVLITPAPETAISIRRAKRMSDFLRAECYAVTVQKSGTLSGLSEAERESMERHLNFARNLRIETRVLEGDHVPTTLVDFARNNRITQLFLTRPTGVRWYSFVGRDMVQKIVRLAKDLQVVVISAREPSESH
jgi:two-component system, OmpR family, sensor histidine kinase KdpD